MTVLEVQLATFQYGACLQRLLEILTQVPEATLTQAFQEFSKVWFRTNQALGSGTLDMQQIELFTKALRELLDEGVKEQFRRRLQEI